ncbi:hypothetical protein MMC15_007584, partial [Xylographa vitiligo]|nr:hypothetical protein [Xylographa vitiligo]
MFSRKEASAMLAEEAEAPPPYSPYEINDEKELSNNPNRGLRARWEGTDDFHR